MDGHEQGSEGSFGPRCAYHPGRPWDCKDEPFNKTSSRCATRDKDSHTEMDKDWRLDAPGIIQEISELFALYLTSIQTSLFQLTVVKLTCRSHF